MKSVFGLIGSLLGVVWILFVLLTPLLGVWLGSSLVSYYGGPAELAVAAGVLLFPVIPVLWEARATAKWNAQIAARKQLVGKPKRSLKGFDRIVLRTLVLNGLFLAALIVWFPKVAFAALATRGDWFLLDQQDEISRTVRGACFASASGLEWLHRWANPNPYKKEGDDLPVPETVTPVPVVGPGPQPIRRFPPRPPPVQPDVPDPQPSPEEEEAPAWTVGATVWPRARIVQPSVVALQPSDETSLESVATAIAARERDPFDRVKALHDWVVTRLHYDHASLVPGQRKPQDAKSVFANRTGVCEGYARLMVAFGKVTGDNIVYVVGDVREENGEAAPVGHAWNAVEIKGSWYIIDATWDDPTVDGKGDRYQTDYLFIPPTVAIFDHFPDAARWQLLPKPLSRVEFLRQPFARPGLARVGLVMKNPDRTRVEIDGPLPIEIENPRGIFVMVSVAGKECGIDDAALVRMQCEVPPGRHEAMISTNTQRWGTYWSVATLDVLRQ